MSIAIDYIIAGDDSCQLQFYARGHYDERAFACAVIEYIEREGRDLTLPAGAIIRRTHWRKVPRNNGVIAHEMVETTAGRGAFAVTLCDEWFPLHAHVRRAPARSDSERPL